MHCMQMLLQLKKVNINVSRSSGLGAIERLWSTLSSDVCVPHWVAQSTQTYTGRELPCCLSLSRQNDWKTLHMNKSGYNQKNSALIFVIFVPVLAAVVFCVEERQQSNSDTKKKKNQSKRNNHNFNMNIQWQFVFEMLNRQFKGIWFNILGNMLSECFLVGVIYKDNYFLYLCAQSFR